MHRLFISIITIAIVVIGYNYYNQNQDSASTDIATADNYARSVGDHEALDIDILSVQDIYVFRLSTLQTEYIREMRISTLFEGQIEVHVSETSNSDGITNHLLIKRKSDRSLGVEKAVQKPTQAYPDIKYVLVRDYNFDQCIKLFSFVDSQLIPFAKKLRVLSPTEREKVEVPLSVGGMLTDHILTPIDRYIGESNKN